ncbi:MAG: hypothetical protein V7609_554 [Verrucomicrobiota bacterium]
MMRRRAPVAHERVAIRPADETIEQTVSVDMAAFLSMKKETDSAKSMNPRPHSRQFVHRSFYGTDCAQTPRGKYRRGAEQHRVE